MTFIIKNIDSILKDRVIGFGTIKFIPYGFNWNVLSDEPFLLELPSGKVIESEPCECSQKEFNKL